VQVLFPPILCKNWQFVEKISIKLIFPVLSKDKPRGRLTLEQANWRKKMQLFHRKPSQVKMPVQMGGLDRF